MSEEKEPYGYIYRATNQINGKIYIGKTTTDRWDKNKDPIVERWNEEVKTSYSNKEHGLSMRYIENAVVKYGEENFTLQEQDRAYSEEELNQKERYWIKELDTMNPDKGYNMTEGGEGGAFSEAAKEKLSQIMKEKYDTDPEYRDKQAQERRERANDPEWVQKMTEINRERGNDPEFRQNVSNAIKEKYDTDPEYKQKQTQERRERVQNPEYLAKMTEINQEIARNPESRQKMRESLLHKWKDQEYQAKVSKGVSDKWQDAEFRKKQFKSRVEGRKEITDKEQFFKDIKEMNKKELNKKYDMDGKTTNKRIKEMLGHEGVNNFSEAKKYLENKNLNDVISDVDERMNDRLEDPSKKKVITNKQEFLNDIQTLSSKELSEKYNMNRTTVNRRIREMLKAHGVNNFRDAKEYLKDKNLNDVVRDINERTSDQSHKWQGTSKIENKEEFLNDVKAMQKNEINHKYGMDGKTINRRIKEMFGEEGVQNYSQLKEYLKDKDVKEVLKSLEEKEEEEEPSEEPKEGESEDTQEEQNDKTSTTEEPTDDSEQYEEELPEESQIEKNSKEENEFSEESEPLEGETREDDNLDGDKIEEPQEEEELRIEEEKDTLDDSTEAVSEDYDEIQPKEEGEVSSEGENLSELAIIGASDNDSVGNDSNSIDRPPPGPSQEELLKEAQIQADLDFIRNFQPDLSDEEVWAAEEEAKDYDFIRDDSELWEKKEPEVTYLNDNDWVPKEQSTSESDPHSESASKDYDGLRDLDSEAYEKEFSSVPASKEEGGIDGPGPVGEIDIGGRYEESGPDELDDSSEGHVG